MTTSTPPLLRLAPVLRRQFGVFTTRQAAARGVSRSSVAALWRRGVLTRLSPDVYRCTLVPDTWEGRALAGQLSGGPNVVLSRWAAARIQGLTHPSDAEIELVVPRGRFVRTSADPRPKTSRRLRPHDVTTVGRLRCGSVAWTIAELSAVTSASTVERLATRAVAEGRTTTRELADMARHLSRAPGVGVLREVVGATSLVEPGSRSRAESRFVALVVSAGLPRPVVNHAVTDASGRRRELDAAWTDYGVAVELDLHPSHATTLGRRSDGARQNDLVHDWLLLRFDGHDLDHRSRQMLDQVRRALLVNGWQNEGRAPGRSHLDDR
jgi:hypothetical protein